jgi:hypothetical protein
MFDESFLAIGQRRLIDPVICPPIPCDQPELRKICYRNHGSPSRHHANAGNARSHRQLGILRGYRQLQAQGQLQIGRIATRQVIA